MRGISNAGATFACFLFASALTAANLIGAPVSAEPASSGGPPLLVTYGIGAHPQEGDPDKRQALYFSVPADSNTPLFVRLFDPDSGGAHDQITTRGPNTTTRFTVFGGKGADASRFARPERISHQEETLGTRLLQREFRAEPEFDNAWMTLGSVTPDQGELVDGRYVFRLLVHGLRGHDGNVFDFAISSSDTENVPPLGLRKYSYGPTTRTPVEGMLTELRFRIPDDAQSITVGTFDAASAETLLALRFDTYPLAASGQNNWEVTNLLLSTQDRGSLAAITLEGGEEIPNDATFYVTDQNGKLIPFELPVRLLAPRPRPVAAGTTENLEPCMGVRFDASKSSDPQGGALSYRWRFGDGNSATGPMVSHHYAVEGPTTAWLEVTNESPRVGNGAAIPLPIFVKRPPVARSVVRAVVAIDEEVEFDGSSSSASFWNVVRHEWQISDGTVLTGSVASHIFRKPGTYRIKHSIQDDSENRCDNASEEFEIRVNAPPVASAGAAQLVTASVVQFDGSASHDPDGDSIIRYDWDFGDGSTGTGVKPAHVYAAPGTYEVRLTVTDSAGTVRNNGSDTTRVVVNARPIADAGPELVGTPGQVLTFDGSRSIDPDGKISEYLWDFRDGTTASGETVTHAFAAPGIYKVRLRVKDDTGHDEATDFQEVQVFINHPPVAVAGPAVVAGPGDEVKLSGASSYDRDGEIVGYRWDFSDRTEPLQGVEVSRRFENPGVYTVKLTVTDDSGAVNASASAETRVAINHAPVAHAGDNIETNATTISFDGSNSVDADGDPLTYAWEFGDGNKASGARVTHTYKEGGNYTVQLVVDDGKGLHNSTNRTSIAVRIDRPPVAVAGANQTACTGDILAFDGGKSSDPEGGVLRYLWDFGEGTKSEIANPTMSYRKGGLYPVTLTVRDDSGMAQNAHTDRIAVQIDQGPIATIGPREVLACTNSEVTFDGSKSTDVDGVVNSFRWDFGDGNFGGGERPTHIYERPGEYRVFLTIQGEKVGQCSDTSTDEIPVRIIAGPTAVIKAPGAVPVTAPIAFDGSSSQFSAGKITGWRWDFGDGSTATGAQVSHKYGKAGTYRVTLTIASDSNEPSCRAVSSRHLVTVNGPPQAAFSATQLVAVGEEVLFDGSGSRDPDGAISAYVWDFGDGNKGTGVTVRHRYRAPGEFKATLTVQDNAGLPNSTATSVQTVKVNASPVANAGTARVSAPGQAIRFDGSKSADPDGNIIEYFWDFGDGRTATGQAATHSFAKPGVYSVRLRVKDNSGHPAAFGFHEVPVVVNHPPVANAGPAISAGPGDDVKLSGVRSFDPDGKIESYRWEFSDDAAPMSGAEVTRSFAKPGIYTAKLTVTDNSGAANATATAETRIAVNHAPVAHAGEDIETNQLTVKFDGAKTADADGDTLVYSWDFGDGNKASGVQAIHTYKQGGVYPVVLTVNDGRGLHNSEDRHGITVRIDRAPVAVAGENQTACTGDVLVFDGGKSSDPEGGVLRYLWEFGEGTKSEIVNPTMSYRKGGLYPVTLTVRDDSGMTQNVHSDRIAVRIDQGPVATATPREVLACANTEVAFDGSTSTDVDGVVNSFRWDFGDGNFGGGPRATHIYQRPGKYRGFLTIQGEKVGNCSDTSTDEISVQIVAGPIAAIKAPAAVPVAEPVQFDGSVSQFSGGKITGWRWDFGDGSTATGAQTTHKYSKSGTYRVTLTITSDSSEASCRSVSGRHLVTVNDPPQASFQVKQLVAVDEEVLFDAAAARDPDGAITLYEWDFGDGNKGTGVTARHVYRAPGSYKVKLTVHDNAGLANSKATTEQTVKVNAPPVPEISGPEVGCVSEPLTWTSDRSSDADGPIRAFRWAFGDGAETTTPSATHRYAKPGRYGMTLYADDGAGLANSKRHVTRSIWVNQPPHAAAGADRLACPGEPVKFDGTASSDPDGKLTRFLWDFGDGNTSEGAQSEHRFVRPGTYNVRLTVTDDSGSSCASDTTALKVLVKAPPVARSGGDREVWVGGANDGILLDASQSQDPDGRPLSFAWDLGDGMSTAGERVRHVIPAPGEYKASLTVSDMSGLSCGTATDSFKIIARERK